MPTVEALPSASILNQAERELGAFLRAVTPLVGGEGLERARDLWIETLRDADCPAAESTRFFRSVTIHTISQLAGNSEDSIPTAMKTIDSRLNMCA
jgi:hypothetical protein